VGEGKDERGTEVLFLGLKGGGKDEPCDKKSPGHSLARGKKAPIPLVREKIGAAWTRTEVIGEKGGGDPPFKEGGLSRISKKGKGGKGIAKREMAHRKGSQGREKKKRLRRGRAQFFWQFRPRKRKGGTRRMKGREVFHPPSCQGK